MGRTLLIVDDERNIRLGLRAMIERARPDAYRIELAADGRQALELLERERADIVVTDIRMPEMDGIALIRRLAERPDPPAVIILSGYDDFQYAREAITHDVKAYLLKPIVREELYAALDKVEASLAREASIQVRLEETDRYRSGLALRTLQLVTADPRLPEAEAEARCREAGLDGLEPAYIVVAAAVTERQLGLLRSLPFLQTAEAEREAVSFVDRDGHWIVATTRAELPDRLLPQLAAGGGDAAALGVSEPGQAIGQLRAKYDEAKHALKYRLLPGQGEPALIRYGSVRDRRRAYPSPLDRVRKLANLVGADRDKELRGLLLELFDAQALAEADIGYFEQVSEALNTEVFDRVFRVYGEASVEIIRLYKQAGSPYHFRRMQDYIHAVEGLLLGLSAYVRDLKSAHADPREMRRAIAYIRDNYDKDLNMAIVSNHVSLNYSYFSERFKAFTGESFVQYLKKVRIEKAKELLEATEDKVYEIGRRVGYDNPKQFQKVFRELEGVSPQTYRENAGWRAER